MNITYDNGLDDIKIYINDILHLFLKKEQIVGIRSWYISLDKDPDPFFIDILFTNNIIHIQYDTREKWLKILEIINKIL